MRPATWPSETWLVTQGGDLGRDMRTSDNLNVGGRYSGEDLRTLFDIKEPQSTRVSSDPGVEPERWNPLSIEDRALAAFPRVIRGEDLPFDKLEHSPVFDDLLPNAKQNPAPRS